MGKYKEIMLYVFVSVIIYKWLLCVYVVYICISYKICIFEDFKDVWFKICVINLVVKLIMDNWNCVMDGDDIFMRYINRSSLKLWMYGKI